MENLWAVRTLSRTPLESSQCSPDPLAGREGLAVSFPRTPLRLPLSALGLDFRPSGLPQRKILETPLIVRFFFWWLSTLSTNFYEVFEGRGASQQTIRIWRGSESRNFLTEFLPLRDMDNYKNIAGSVALTELFAVRLTSGCFFTHLLNYGVRSCILLLE